MCVCDSVNKRMFILTCHLLELGDFRDPEWFGSRSLRARRETCGVLVPSYAGRAYILSSHSTDPAYGMNVPMIHFLP